MAFGDGYAGAELRVTQGGWALTAMVMTAKEFVFLAAPILGAALVSGVLIGLIQVASQISDMSVSFVPKLIIVMLVFLVSMHWLLGSYVSFLHHFYQQIPVWVNTR